MITFIHDTQQKLLAIVVLSFLGLSWSSASQAGTKESMVLFYGSIKLIQVTALSGAADMWSALGSAAKAQECTGLANDLQKGDLANEDGMKKFVAASNELKEQLEQLQEAGAPLTAEQMKKARAANFKIFGTTVLWIGAGVTGVKVLKADNLNMLEKIALTVAVAGEVQNALSATKQLTSAFSSYNDMAKGGDHRPPSKELAEKFASL